MHTAFLTVFLASYHVNCQDWGRIAGGINQGFSFADQGLKGLRNIPGANPVFNVFDDVKNGVKNVETDPFNSLRNNLNRIQGADRVVNPLFDTTANLATTGPLKDALAKPIEDAGNGVKLAAKTVNQNVFGNIDKADQAIKDTSKQVQGIVNQQVSSVIPISEFQSIVQNAVGDFSKGDVTGGLVSLAAQGLVLSGVAKKPGASKDPSVTNKLDEFNRNWKELDDRLKILYLSTKTKEEYDSVLSALNAENRAVTLKAIEQFKRLTPEQQREYINKAVALAKGESEPETAEPTPEDPIVTGWSNLTINARLYIWTEVRKTPEEREKLKAALSPSDYKALENYQKQVNRYSPVARKSALSKGKNDYLKFMQSIEQSNQ